jgi:predicted nucleic acid-binding protein
VRFWDTSAVVPLLVSEPWSKAMRSLLRSDDALTVWWATRVECASAVRQRERRGALKPEWVPKALERLGGLGAGWSEISPSEAVRAQAERAVAVHPLRAADALQLGAALVWRQDPGARGELVSLDQRLRDAASREGFKVLPAELGA